MPIIPESSEFSAGLVSVVVEINTAKKVALWGTYGKNGIEHCGGRCPEHQLHYIRLADCSTEHLQAILKNQPYVSLSDYGLIIQTILKERMREKGRSTIWERIRKFWASLVSIIF
jgi:hypothetical protein